VSGCVSAAVTAVDYYLPESVLTNADLVRQFPGWTEEKIEEKTGIASRHIAAEDEFASDLAVKAAERLFSDVGIAPKDVDFVLLCTQSPDYLIPTTACFVQKRLGIPTSAGALDFNLGCSGFMFGLAIGKSLIEAGQATRVLLLTAETYSKHLRSDDVSTRTIFGDGAAAALIEAQEVRSPRDQEWIGPFVYGTDGRGKNNLISRRWSLREGAQLARNGSIEDDGGPCLFMNGAEIFSFTLNAVPMSVSRLLEKAGLSLADIDHFVFHQANRFILEHLRRKIRIPEEKFVYAMNDCGNTVSSTIPIALSRAAREGRFQLGDRLMLVGFGVGYSWSAGILNWLRPSTGGRETE
jgi:3-oxoacyl-[acyl-carrier-protein] synthase-3